MEGAAATGGRVAVTSWRNEALEQQHRVEKEMWRKGYTRRSQGWGRDVEGMLGPLQRAVWQRQLSLSHGTSEGRFARC